MPSVSRTWAPRGNTPHLQVAGNWDKISAISGISVSPKMKRLGLYIRFHPDKNIRQGEVVEFLTYLQRHLRGHIVIVWDNNKTHKGNIIKAYLQQHPRIHRYFFPSYAPELNPDEFVWTNLKRAVANSVPKDQKHLLRTLSGPTRRLRRSQALLWSCIRASALPWIQTK